MSMRVFLFLCDFKVKWDFFSTGSKLTAGIHKLADSLTKTAKGKSFNKQSTSPTTENVNAADGKPGKPTLERKVSFDDKVNYIDRQASTENLVDKDEENKTEEPVVGVQNGSVTHEEGQQADGYLVLREATNEEKEVELKVQQKIEATKKGEEGSQPVSCLFDFIILMSVQGAFSRQE